MIDGIGNYFAAAAHNERGQEAMHMIESRHDGKCLLQEDLNSAAAVRCSVLENSTANSVGNARADQSPARVLSFGTHTGDHSHIVRLARLQQQSDHARDICRIILSVAIERGNNVARGSIDSGHEGGALPAAGRMFHDSKLRKIRLNIIQH